MRKQTVPRDVALIVAVSTLAGFAWSGHEMSKADRHWLEVEAAPLLTEEERELFEDLDSDEDRRIFKRIFWSRRNPTPGEPRNKFKEDYETRLETVIREMEAAGRQGVITDKGKIFLLLGAPSQSNPVTTAETPVSIGETDAEQVGRIPESSTERLRRVTDTSPPIEDSNLGLSDEDQSGVETWAYEPNEALGIPDGLTLRFRAPAGFGYRLILDKNLRAILERIKTRIIVNPEVTYARDAQGHLVDRNIDERAPPASGEVNPILMTLRDTGRVVSDIEFQVEVFFFRSNDKSIFMPILFRIDGTSMSWMEGKARAALMGLIEDGSGNRVNQFEETAVLTEKPDGRTTFEMPIVIEPGVYVLYLGVRDEESSRLGTKIMPLEVPAFGTDKLAISSILLFTEGKKVEEHLSSPGRAFVIGGFRFTPRLDRVYRRAEKLSGVFHAYGYELEQGVPRLTVQYIFLQDGIKNGCVEPHPFISTGPEIAITVFDMPLGSFEPGDYTLRIEVTDHAKNETITKDIDFEVE